MAANKREAQQRVDRIRAFRQELEELGREKVLVLSDEQRKNLNEHLDRTLENLAARFDVDITESQRQISWGMRIASVLGGLAFCAAVVLFFYRFWGLVSTPMQVGILVLAPILGLLAVEFAARRERALYYASLLSLVALASFILNLTVLGTIFHLTPSRNALLAWGAFALALAYNYGLRLPLAAGLLCLLVYGAATIASWSGYSWQEFGARPENVIPAGLALLAVPMVVKRRGTEDFSAVYRLIGLLSVFLALLILSNSGGLSYLPLRVKRIEVIYQLAGFAAAGLAIWLGISRHTAAAVNLGAAFFAILLLSRFVDWWWDWMPRYLFFLLIGAIAVLLLAVFHRLRARAQERRPV